MQTIYFLKAYDSHNSLTTWWPLGDHLVTTWWPLVDHLVTTWGQFGDRLVTIWGPFGDHLMSTWWPLGDPLMTTHRFSLFLFVSHCFLPFLIVSQTVKKPNLAEIKVYCCSRWCENCKKTVTSGRLWPGRRWLDKDKQGTGLGRLAW